MSYLIGRWCKQKKQKNNWSKIDPRGTPAATFAQDIVYLSTTLCHLESMKSFITTCKLDLLAIPYRMPWTFQGTRPLLKNHRQKIYVYHVL